MTKDFKPPAGFTAEEKADGNRGIRWIMEDGVYGRPSNHDVREYLKRTPQMGGCTCDACNAFYGNDSTLLTDALKSTTAHLASAISLLERGSKKAAPSDKMFDIMLDDYRKSLEAARGVLQQGEK